MWIILLILITGVVAGYILSRFRGVHKLADKATMYIIYVLLLFMGLSVGSEPEVMKNLADIGLDALLIALFAIGGSVLTAFILYRIIFKAHEE